MFTPKWIALFLLAAPVVFSYAETNALPRQVNQSRIRITTANTDATSTTYRVNGKKATEAEYKETKTLFDELESMTITNSQSSASSSFTWKAGEKPKQEFTVNGKKVTRREFLAAGKPTPQPQPAPPEK